MGGRLSLFRGSVADYTYLFETVYVLCIRRLGTQKASLEPDSPAEGEA